MARKSGNVFRGGRMRRQTLWLGGPFVTTTLASTNAVALTASLSAAGLALRPFTIVRTRGVWQVRSDQTAALESYGAMMGFAVVSDQAAAIGVTAVPTPDTDIQSDAWFVHEMQFGTFGFISGVGTQELGQPQRTYDSKAMRKVEEGFDFVQVMEASVNSASIHDAFRILVKLH